MLDPVAPETPSTALAIRAPSSLAVVDPTALALALREPGLLDISPAVSQRLAELDVVHEIAARERDEAAAIVVDVRRARWKALLDAPLNPAAPTCTCGRALLPPRITRDMKATLRQRGYDDAAIAGLTVLGATNIIAGNVVEAPYTSPRFCSEKCWLSHQNAIIALDPYDAEDVDRAVAAAEAQVDRRVAQTVALMLQPSAALMLQPSAEQRAREALHAAAATLHDIIAHRGPGTERSRHAEALYPLARQRARAVWAAWLASLMDALVARGDQYGPPPRRHCVACSLPLPEAVDAAIVRTCEKAGCAKKATADSTDDTWGRPCGWCNLWFKHPESPAPPGFDADADLGLTILGLPAGPSAAIADAITDVTRTVRRGRSTRKPPGLWAGPIIAIDEHETFVDGIDPRRLLPCSWECAAHLPIDFTALPAPGSAGYETFWELGWHRGLPAPPPTGRERLAGANRALRAAARRALDVAPPPARPVMTPPPGLSPHLEAPGPADAPSGLQADRHLARRPGEQDQRARLVAALGTILPGLFERAQWRIRPAAVSTPPRLGIEEIREALPGDLRRDVTLVVLGQALARHSLVERAGRQANRTMYQARPGT